MGHWTITALREAYRSGEVSPVEIVDAALVRIKRWNLRLRAYLQVSEKQARRAARESERRFRFGDERGPLDGVPVAYKDLCHIPGIPTTCGSLIFRDDPPPDAASSVWRRLENAGAVNMGKLNMAELAMGPTGRNMHFGDPQNPWKRGHVTGGSSSGSACAVAAGLALAAIGSDTGGSIRVPAALCGVVGLKPTNGRVSRHGAIPLSWTLDAFGPLTRTAADNALVLSVIAGADPWIRARARAPSLITPGRRAKASKAFGWARWPMTLSPASPGKCERLTRRRAKRWSGAARASSG